VLSSCRAAHSEEVVPNEEKSCPTLPPRGLLEEGAFPHGELPARIPFTTWALGVLPWFLLQPQLCFFLFCSGSLFLENLVTAILLSTPSWTLVLPSWHPTRQKTNVSSPAVERIDLNGEHVQREIIKSDKQSFFERFVFSCHLTLFKKSLGMFLKYMLSSLPWFFSRAV